MNKKILKAGRHLDLGCGTKPRNPYNFSELCGVDLYRSEAIDDTFDIRVANLSIEGIPFPDNHFDSVSAFDFLEHIPRVMLKNDTETRFPFIELMNEIWRVLKPGGLFYALTPATLILKHFKTLHMSTLLLIKHICTFAHKNYMQRIMGLMASSPN